MARRSTSESVQLVEAAGTTDEILVASGAYQVVAPKTVIVTASGSNIITTISSNGVPIAYVNVLAGDSKSVTFADGFELALNSGVEFTSDAAAWVSFYYSIYSETPNLNKYTARANTNSNITVTRTPNIFGTQANT